MCAARSFPNWVMLERFIFRVDDDKEFPDDVIRASGLTSQENPFHVAFRLSNPPGISRIYVQLPGFPNSRNVLPFSVVATHRHLVLFSLISTVKDQIDVQDLVIYDASATLQTLPPCTELDNVLLRMIAAWPQVVLAQLCLLRSHISKVASSGWRTIRLPIHVHGNPDDVHQLYSWKTDTVIPFDNQLCWIDYMRGILFYDPAAIVVSFLPFPVDHETPRRNKECFWLYRGVSVLDASGVLKFIDVARDDGLGFESLRRDAGFTVTCYSLVLGEHKKKKKKHRRTMEWREDYKITSNELWSINSLDCLPRTLLMFPQVDIDRPHIVHFLAPELRYVIKKMWVVAIDMNTKIVESSSLYINGKEDLQTEDAGLTRAKSRFPQSFLPSDFSKFITFSSTSSCPATILLSSKYAMVPGEDSVVSRHWLKELFHVVVYFYAV
ncbi:Os12g0172400 [Oryza sativa Japonica Group]|uniref:DUF1618 domain-containing protein n=2 Tax=Oryza sativa subsp. japonica TaxID=39947 RepID=Q2QX22_ORYSJ|nr:hypothetical protein LOC_Os12g07440 [Oryza sativa Japonica Group]BAF29299.1 Os12g0172400 [Oryza sativa Japonica Group]|eukprot:NP_001066280.1 Os12g0172400 [Oryza sativa Japonica Group]